MNASEDIFSRDFESMTANTNATMPTLIRDFESMAVANATMPIEALIRDFESMAVDADIDANTDSSHPPTFDMSNESMSSDAGEAEPAAEQGKEGKGKEQGKGKGKGKSRKSDKDKGKDGKGDNFKGKSRTTRIPVRKGT